MIKVLRSIKEDTLMKSHRRRGITFTLLAVMIPLSLIFMACDGGEVSTSTPTPTTTPTVTDYVSLIDNLREAGAGQLLT